MSYNIELTKEAEKQLLQYIKSGAKKDLLKITVFSKNYKSTRQPQAHRFLVFKTIATTLFDLIQNVSDAIIYVFSGFRIRHGKQFVLFRSLLQIRLDNVLKMY